MKYAYSLASIQLLFAFFSLAQPSFTDVTNSAGLSQTGLNYGVAVADFNNDGHDDVFATRYNIGGLLYKNLGNGHFMDITSMAGIATYPTAQFAVWGDVNNDGWLDLFVAARDEQNALYLNNQNETFIEVATTAGVATGAKVKSALFSDYNNDGWLDIYLARLGAENILYKNNQDGSFSNVTILAGATDPLISMGAIFFDYDNDNDKDLYLTHDANIPNILYRNNGNGTFTDVSAISGTNVAGQGMGVDAGDINNDGWPDLFITNLGANTLLLNQGNGSFTNITQLAGVGDLGMGWGCSFFDFDNDGWQDIYLANDSYFSPYPNVLYHNNGDLTFSAVSGNSPLNSMEAGYGMGCFDFDNDGDVDVYLANYSGSIGNQLFRNELDNQNNWLKVKAIGTQSNKAGIGAKLRLEVGGQLLIDEVNGGSGWASQNSLTLHFGLGTAEIIDLMTVTWPSGIVDSFTSLPVNQLVNVIEGEVIEVPEIPDSPNEPEQEEGLELPTADHYIDNFEDAAVVMPNPTNGYINLIWKTELMGYDNFEVQLSDIAGNTIYAGKVSKQKLQIDVRDFPSGIYVLKLFFDGKFFVKPIIKL